MARGTSPICGNHGVVSQGLLTNYFFTYTQAIISGYWYDVIKNLAPGGGVYPNNDFQLDNAIAIVTHELFESILSSQLIKSGSSYTFDPNGAAFQSVNSKPKSPEKTAYSKNNSFFN